MTKFAAYDNFAIYAVGDTRKEAVQNARDDAGDPDSEFSTAPVSDSLAAQIERHGWDGHRQSFDIRDDEIVDTTDV